MKKLEKKKKKAKFAMNKKKGRKVTVRCSASDPRKRPPTVGKWDMKAK